MKYWLIRAGAMLALFLSLTWRTVEAAPSYNPKSGDPCSINVRTVVPINLTAGGQVITGVANKTTYICSLHIITATAQNIALVSGTGTTCATNTAGMAGGATAATGWNFGTTNQSLALGNGGLWIMATATTGQNVCLLLSGSGQTSGALQFVQQ